MNTGNHAKTGAQIVYFSHGGGPLPILGDASHQKMIAFMTRLPERLRKPKAILVISAHSGRKRGDLAWGCKSTMFYDYYGFPPQAYELSYSRPRQPGTGRKDWCAAWAGRSTRVDPQRGLAQGCYIRLKLMYPAADIPALQLSLLRGLSPTAHLALGKALRGLGENILVIGSGFSFHNMRVCPGRGWKQDPANDAFQDWLIETCAGELQQPERQARLSAWEQAPYARYCHPREEHLLPLLVCAGWRKHRLK